MGGQFPNHRLNWCPLPWEHGVLTTREVPAVPFMMSQGKGLATLSNTYITEFCAVTKLQIRAKFIRLASICLGPNV